MGLLEQFDLATAEPVKPPAKTGLLDQFAEPEPEQPGFFETVGKGFRAGAGAAHEDVARGAQVLTGQEPKLPEPEAAAPDAKRPWLNRFANFLGTTAGSSMPFLEGAGTGGVVGAGVGGPAAPVTGLLGAAGGGAVMAGLQQVGDTYAQARARGKSHEEAAEIAYAAGSASGAINGISVLLGPVGFAGKVGLAGVKKKIANALFQTFAVQPGVGVGDQAVQNVIAQQTYDPERRIAEGLPQAYLGEVLFEAPATAAVAAAAVRKGEPVVTPAPVEQPPAEAEPVIPAEVIDAARPGPGDPPADPPAIQPTNPEIGAAQVATPAGPVEAPSLLQQFADLAPARAEANEAMRAPAAPVAEPTPAAPVAPTIPVAEVAPAPVMRAGGPATAALDPRVMRPAAAQAPVAAPRAPQPVAEGITPQATQAAPLPPKQVMEEITPPPVAGRAAPPLAPQPLTTPEQAAAMLTQPLQLPPELVAPARKRIRQKPFSFAEILSRAGGIKDTGGELKAMNAELWHKGKPGLRPLVNNESGISWDRVLELAQQEGFLPENLTDRPNTVGIQEAQDLLFDELGGKPVYAENETGDLADWEATKGRRSKAMQDDEERHHLEGQASDLGMNPAGMKLPALRAAVTDGQVRSALKGAGVTMATPADIQAVLTIANEHGMSIKDAADQHGERLAIQAESAAYEATHDPEVVPPDDLGAESIPFAEAPADRQRRTGTDGNPAQSSAGGATAAGRTEGAGEDTAEVADPRAKLATAADPDHDRAATAVAALQEYLAGGKRLVQIPTYTRVYQQKDPANFRARGVDVQMVEGYSKGKPRWVTLTAEQVDRLLRSIGKRQADRSIDKIDAGDQRVIPGAEKITDKQLAERKAAQPLRPNAPQKKADEGLFDTDAKKQADLPWDKKTELYTFGYLPTPVRNAYARMADKVMARIDSTPWGKFFDPLIRLGPEFKKLRYETFGHIAQVDRMAAKVADSFKGLDPAQMRTAYDYLTTANATPAALPASHQQNIAAVKNEIDQVGRRLVAFGFLPQQTYAGQYLPRIYLRYLLDTPVNTGTLRGKMSDRGYAKARDPNLSQFVRDVVLGEIKDPAYLSARAYAQPMRDLVVYEFLENVAANPQWAYQPALIQMGGQRVTSTWAREEAQALRKQADYMRDPALAQQARALAQQLDAAADQAGAPPADKTWTQMPETSAYGPLRGMWVKTEIYNDLVASFRMLPKDASWLESWFGVGGAGTKATQVWKTLKVAFNPPSQARNFISNMVALDVFADVDKAMVPVRIAQAIRQIVKDGPAWQVAKQHGVTATTFAAQELGQIERQMIRDLGAKRHPMRVLTDHAEAILEAGGASYGFIESIFKTAVIIDQLAKGKSGSDAAAHAHEALFDYSNAPPWVRYMRNTPLLGTFVTYSYKALPKAVETAIKRPWKYAPYIAVATAIPYAIAGMYDVDQEDVDKLREAMPEFIRKRGGSMLWPFKGTDGKWDAVNMSYFFPWGGFQSAGHLVLDAAKKFGKGEIAEGLGASAEALGSVAIGGGPLTDIIAALATNRDPFTGKLIVDPATTPKEQLLSLLTYVWGMAAPGWVTNTGAAKHIWDALSGKVDAYTGDPKETPVQAFLRLIGVNVYPFDPRESQAANLRRMEGKRDDTVTAMNKAMRDRNLDAEERGGVRDDYRAKVSRLEQEMREYRKKSTVPPALQ